MKKLISIISVGILILSSIHTTNAQVSSDELDSLLGEWKLDMSPQDKTDSNFAWMKITRIDERTVEGEFYRESVAIQNGRVNTQRGIVYVALISGDNSGEYNSTFYLKDGILYGTTHAVDRGFLAVWTAEKVN